MGHKLFSCIFYDFCLKLVNGKIDSKQKNFVQGKKEDLHKKKFSLKKHRQNATNRHVSISSVAVPPIFISLSLSFQRFLFWQDIITQKSKMTTNMNAFQY